MKKIILGISLLSITDISGQSFHWAVSYDCSTNNSSFIEDLVVDAGGNTIAVGRFRDSIDLDPGTSVIYVQSQGDDDLFVTKVDQNGNYLWGFRLGGTINDVAEGVDVDAVGNIYITGYKQGSQDMDPGPGTAIVPAYGNQDGFILKLTPQGTFIWVKVFEGVIGAGPMDICIDGSGNILTTGHFSNGVDFDPGPLLFILGTSSGSDAFISKLDSGGNFIWAVELVSVAGNEYGMQIGIDGLGCIYNVGYFDAGLDCDPGPGSYVIWASGGNWEGYVLKLDSNGVFRWGGQLGGPGDDFAKAIAVRPNGDICIAGEFEQTADLDPGNGVSSFISNGDRDVYVIKLDSSRNYQWAGKWGAAWYDEVFDVSIDVNGDVYTTGNFWQTVDFNPGSGINNVTSVGRDAYISRLDSSGNYEWLVTYGGGWISSGSALFNGPAGELYAGGAFSDTIDFNPGPGTWIMQTPDYGRMEGYIVKFGNCLPPPTGVSVSGNTLTANFTGGTYQWLNCGTEGQPIPGATSIAYTTSTTGSFAVIITDGTCVDTSGCYFAFAPSSVHDWELGEIVVSPNPCRNYFQVRFPVFIKADLCIRNVAGQQITEYAKFEGDLWDCELNVPPGIYMIEFYVAHLGKRFLPLVVY